MATCSTAISLEIKKIKKALLNHGDKQQGSSRFSCLGKENYICLLFRWGANDGDDLPLAVLHIDSPAHSHGDRKNLSFFHSDPQEPLAGRP